MNTLITKDRLDELIRIAKLCPRGPIAEIGVYKGGSLKYLADAFPDRRLYGFDTFEGLPAAYHSEIEIHKPGEFADTHVESVARFINNPRVELIKGLFPESVWAIGDDTRFSFVHVDTDFYLSVKACIEWFVPRMMPGGVMVFDDFDWPNCPGVRKALEESGKLWSPTRAKFQAAIWQRPLVVRNDNDLIGDFIGTIPAMQELAKGAPMEVHCGVSMFELLSMAGLKPHAEWRRHQWTPDERGDLAFDLHAAFKLAAKDNLHMTQANFHAVGLPIPPKPVRPSFVVRRIAQPYFDYILSPFSRSLPENERWPKEYWRQLVDLMPSRQFAVIGGDNDDHDYIPNATTSLFGHHFTCVSNLLKEARYGLISVVTGTSHLAHALGVRNFLFCNQGPWGKNPDAIVFEGNIPSITPEQVVQKLRQWESR